MARKEWHVNIAIIIIVNIIITTTTVIISVPYLILSYM